MKYEIIFKNGQIKNVVSKDVNKVKNYITESFDSIKSVKKLNEAASPKIKALLENLCHEFDYEIQYKQYDVSYSSSDGNYYIAYVANSGPTVKTCIKAFSRVLQNWVGEQKLLPTINCKVFFSEREGDGSQRAWDIKECMRDSDMYNVAFQVGNDGDTNYITYYNTQMNPERKAEGMHSLAYYDSIGDKEYIIKSGGGYSTTDDMYNDWDQIYKTADRKAAKAELRKAMEFFGDDADIRVVKTPSRR